MSYFILIAKSVKGVDAIKKHISKDRNVTPVKLSDVPYKVKYIVSGRFKRLFNKRVIVLSVKDTMASYDCKENIDYEIEVLE